MMKRGSVDEVIYFIGIGGIGVSALAKYYLSTGAKVSGSDLVSSENTDELKKLGVAIRIGKQARKNLPKDVTFLIYTAATPRDNPELQEVRRRKLKVQSYPEAIGDLTKRYKTITVSGAHGKSTTTALAALVLEEGYFDPTVIVGTRVKEFGNSNFRLGRGSHLVLEADEWNKSFLKYAPQIAIVTNIDAEHLDTYKTVDAVERAFAEYLGKVPAEGAIIANRDDRRLAKIARKFGKKVIWYSRGDEEAGAMRHFLRVPGEHNVVNALAALRLGQVLGIQSPSIWRAVSRFSGTWRRFEFKGISKGAFIFTDYGHHPSEIQATLSAARERFPFRRIWCVYQPHQYQRLAYLWDDFIGAFDMADRVCLLPVYDVVGRETKTAKSRVSSEKLAHAIASRGKDVYYHTSFAQAKSFIDSKIRPGDILLIMGAGDIYQLTNQITAH